MLRDWIARFVWGQLRQPSGLIGRFIGNGMARGNEYDARWTISLLDLQPESHVLEIGFGPGVSTQYAAEKASQGFVAGIDHSETMVQVARRRNAQVIKAGRMDLKQGDVASLPYPDESFDKAFSIHSIYFWAKPVDCLKELRRCSSRADCSPSPSCPQTNGMSCKDADRVCGPYISAVILLGCFTRQVFARCGSKCAQNRTNSLASVYSA